MGMRQLDVGQCSCSGSKNLEIDGYTGDSPAFREKVTIPVMPVLEKVTAAVKAALSATTGARQGLPARTALDESRLKKVAEALTNVSTASTECEALATKTKDTPYALIGLQLRDLRTGELAPAAESLTSSKKDADPSRPLTLAEVHLRQALAWLEKLTKQAAAVEKAEAAEALAQKIKQMHRIFIEDSMKLLEQSKAGGSGSPSLGTVELSEKYAQLLKERMDKLNAIMKEFAKLLESDPDLMARYLAGQAKGATDMQERLLALLSEQQGLNVQTASLAENAASDAARANAAAGLKAECQSRYEALSSQLAGILRLGVAWYPKTLSKKEGPGVDFLEAVRDASAALLANPPAAMAEIDRAVSALNILGVLPETAQYASLRREEIITVKLTAMWLESLTEAANGRKLGRAGELKQRDVARRTREFAERIEGPMMQFAAKWPEAEKAATAVRTSLFQGTLPHQRAAAGFLHVDHWTEAKASQREAAKGLMAAAAAWKNLINIIAEEMKKNPPEPGEMPDTEVPSLDDLRALMEKEAMDFDNYGLPHWCSNIEIISDWQKQCSSSSSGKGGKPNQGNSIPMPSPGAAMQAAQERERALEREAAKAQEAANAQARAHSSRPPDHTSETRKSGDNEGHGTAKSASDNTAARRSDWNRLPSELTKDLRQQNDNPPPEEYRRAVETYFRRIGVDNSAPALSP
jgi:hypothetical protein